MEKKKRYTIRNYGSYMMDNPKKYWFKRKLYGWGWIPVTWQGWLITALFLAVILVQALAIKNGGQTIYYTIRIIFFAAALIWICFATGEKPKWTWGR